LPWELAELDLPCYRGSDVRFFEPLDEKGECSNLSAKVTAAMVTFTVIEEMKDERRADV
jgi:hypothetical protein